MDVASEIFHKKTDRLGTVLTIPIFRQEKERPDAPQRLLLHERRSVLFYFLFCQKHHDLITSLYKCRHLFRIQRLVRQNRQEII